MGIDAHLRLDRRTRVCARTRSVLRGCGRQLEDVPLAADLGPTFAAQLRPSVSGVVGNGLEEGIVVARIVVDEHQLPSLALMGERQRVGKLE